MTGPIVYYIAGRSPSLVWYEACYADGPGFVRVARAWTRSGLVSKLEGYHYRRYGPAAYVLTWWG